MGLADVLNFFVVVTVLGMLAGGAMIWAGVVRLDSANESVDFFAWTRARGAIACGVITLLVAPVVWTGQLFLGDPAVAQFILPGARTGAMLGCGLAAEAAVLAGCARRRRARRLRMIAETQSQILGGLTEDRPDPSA